MALPFALHLSYTCVSVQNDSFYGKKHNQLSFQKYALVQMAKKKPKLGTKKLYEYFYNGKTQACTILKNKVCLLERYDDNASSMSFSKEDTYITFCTF